MRKTIIPGTLISVVALLGGVVAWLIFRGSMTVLGAVPCGTWIGLILGLVIARMLLKDRNPRTMRRDENSNPEIRPNANEDVA
jgi:zinc transporter ZupT